jgi:hypothetical protein
MIGHNRRTTSQWEDQVSPALLSYYPKYRLVRAHLTARTTTTTPPPLVQSDKRPRRQPVQLGCSPDRSIQLETGQEGEREHEDLGFRCESRLFPKPSCVSLPSDTTRD